MFDGFIQEPQGCLSKNCPHARKCGRHIGNIRRAIVRRSADFKDRFNSCVVCSTCDDEGNYKEWAEYECGPNADYGMFLKGRL